MSKVDKTGARVQQMFAEIAPRYDLMNHLLSLNIDKRWRRQAVSMLKLDRTETILDVCTGTGDLAIELAERIEGRASVIGTDFCREMLDIARRKQQVKKISVDKLQFLEADTQSLPLEDESCQSVSVAFGIRNVQDTDRGIREMMRVCRKGGQVLILEFSHPTLPVLKQFYSAYFKHVLPRIGQGIAKNSQSAYSYLPASVKEFPSGPEVVQLMQGLGLQQVTWKPLTFGVASIYVGIK